MRFCPACASRFSQDVRFCPTDGLPTLAVPEAEQSTVDPLLGSVVDGRYRVDRVLGEGGMGVVYSAMHVVLGKRVALKVLRHGMAGDEDVVQRFMQEAQASSSIGHPNIIDITDFGKLLDGTSYFVMEHLEGLSLTELIEQGGSMDAEDALGIVEQVASALSAAHARGIIHRDLKPDNIFLVRRAEQKHFVKVLDFGIAKVIGANSKLTKTGLVFGTPYYMSPEQAAGQTVDARADIYALGIIMYEMFTGTVPFDGDTFMGILSKHMFESPVPPREHIAAAHLPVEPVILKCLGKRPEDRYASMDALIADLRSVDSIAPVAIGKSARQSALPLSAPGKTQMPPARSSLGPSSKLASSSSRPWVVLGVIMALVMLGGVAGAAMALMQPREEIAPAVAQVPSVTSVPVPASAPLAPASVATGARPTETPAPRAAEAVVAVQGAVTLIVTDPPGAVVAHDGAMIGNTPLEVPRPDTDATTLLTISRPGFSDARVAVTAHSPERVEISLSRVPPPTRRERRHARRQVPTTVQPSTPPTSVDLPRNPDHSRLSDVIDPWGR